MSTRLRVDWGRHLYGVSSIAFGIIAIVWHDFNDWLQLRSLWSAPGGNVIVYLAGAALVVGGSLVQFHRTTKAGALVLATTYFFFALRWVPRVLAQPRVYDNLGNFFEQFSLAIGALIVYAREIRSEKLAQIGRMCLGICVASFAIEQTVYLSGTAEFVPKWIPPGQTFWAITTTFAFALAALAILSGWFALPATRLLTAMIVIFGLLIWVPMLFVAMPSHMNWGGNAENFAIAGSVWILGDWFAGTRRNEKSGSSQT